MLEGERGMAIGCKRRNGNNEWQQAQQPAQEFTVHLDQLQKV